ncbi:hypothetical protein Goshw_017114, partial [Gossypium schwendimanii]|nr:hypothetical protein [Gossypium schwendimanii]
ELGRRRDLPSGGKARPIIGQKLSGCTKQNLFLIVFETEEDLETVMEGQPWLFRTQLILFNWLVKPVERSQIRLISSPYWIKIGPCLPEFDKKDLLHAIVVTFGGVIRSERRLLLS